MQAVVGSPRGRRRWLALAIALALAVLAVWFASHIPRTLSVFVIAAFVAFGVQPLVVQLERRMPRALAIALVYAGLIAVAIVLALLVVPATLVQVQSIATDTPTYLDAVQHWVDALQTFLRAHLGRNLLPPGASDLRGLIADQLSSGMNTTLASLTGVLLGAFTAAFIVISALVLSAFFLAQGQHLADACYDLFPRSRRPAVRALGAELGRVFSGYVSGQLVLCTIVGLSIFALSALIGFRFALLLGIVAGIAYAVPFAGQVVAHLIALVLAAPQGGATVLWVQAIVFGVGRIADNVLVPKIMAQSVGISPIVVMFAVFAGGELFGFPGLILGIPAAALLNVGWRFARSELFVASPDQPVQTPQPSARPEVVVLEGSGRAFETSESPSEASAGAS
ncbi:MAG: AI-2E family transporter [Vulcanimicrobiaceae bacterium]